MFHGLMLFIEKYFKYGLTLISRLKYKQTNND